MDGDDPTIFIEYTAATHTWLCLGIINYRIAAAIFSQAFVNNCDRLSSIKRITLWLSRIARCIDDIAHIEAAWWGNLSDLVRGIASKLNRCQIDILAQNLDSRGRNFERATVTKSELECFGG